MSTTRGKYKIFRQRLDGIKADVAKLDQAIDLMEGADLAGMDAERDFNNALLLLADRVNNLRVLMVE